MKRAASNSRSQNEQVKKSRQGRRNDRQLAFMVDYMVQNPHVATGKFHTLNGKNDLAGSWEELITSLNDLRNPGVKEKDIKSWKESWRDLKTKVSKKASGLRNAKRKTGNKSIELDELTEIEKKVLGLVGFDYIEGTECPDSWPEKLPDDVERLYNGDTSILNVVPTPLTLRQNNDSNTITEDITDGSQLTPDIFDEPMSPIIITVPQSTRSITPEPFIAKSTEKHKLCNRSVSNKKQKSDAKLKTQFSDAREIFTNMANTHNQQLELLTSSLSMVADSNQQMAAAVTKLAENDEKRIKIDEKLIDLLSNFIKK